MSVIQDRTDPSRLYGSIFARYIKLETFLIVSRRIRVTILCMIVELFVKFGVTSVFERIRHLDIRAFKKEFVEILVDVYFKNRVSTVPKSSGVRRSQRADAAIVRLSVIESYMSSTDTTRLQHCHI